MKEQCCITVFFYPLLSYGIVVWGHSARALTRRTFIHQKMAVIYTAGLKELELCRHSFRNLKILTVSSLYIQETIRYVKEKFNCTINNQINTYNTRNNKDYHKFVHKLEPYKRKPSLAGCISYNK
jgi:hypothetical protein